MMTNTLFSQSKLVKSVGLGGGVCLPQGGWDPGFTILAQADFGEVVCLPQGGWDPGFTILAQADFGEVLDYLFLFPYLNYAQAQKTETIENISKDLSIQYFGGGAKLVGYLNSKPRGFYFGGSLSYYYINSDLIQSM
jgi:hypothetical protein